MIGTYVIPYFVLKSDEMKLDKFGKIACEPFCCELFVFCRVER
jgi:hypothetical protein